MAERHLAHGTGLQRKAQVIMHSYRISAMEIKKKVKT